MEESSSQQQEQHNHLKFILRTTCMKNGGFRHYLPLPPQDVFQHSYSVLASELDIKIKRKHTFFNRETAWMRLPVYLTTNKGVLFIYVTDRHGYILSVPHALRLHFEGIKKLCKKNQAIGVGGIAGDNGTTEYDAVFILQFAFGELHIRFSKDDNLRPWSALLIAAHQSNLANACHAVSSEINPAISLESVVSTKSIVAPVYKKDNNKSGKQDGIIFVHRYPRLSTTAETVTADNESFQNHDSSLKIIGSLASSSFLNNSQSCSNTINDFSPSLSKETMPAAARTSFITEHEPAERNYDCDMIHYDAEIIEYQNEKPTSHPSSSAIGTSEVDVTSKDINEFNASTTSINTAILNQSQFDTYGNDKSPHSCDMDSECSGQCKAIDGHHEAYGGSPMLKTYAYCVKLQTPVQKISIADIQKSPPPRSLSISRSTSTSSLHSYNLSKPTQFTMDPTGKRSQVMDFWRQKEIETNANQPPIRIKHVHFKDDETTLQKDTPGKVFDSPTKYYAANVDEGSSVDETLDEGSSVDETLDEGSSVDETLDELPFVDGIPDEVSFVDGAPTKFHDADVFHQNNVVAGLRIGYDFVPDPLPSTDSEESYRKYWADPDLRQERISLTNPYIPVQNEGSVVFNGLQQIIYQRFPQRVISDDENSFHQSFDEPSSAEICVPEDVNRNVLNDCEFLPSRSCSFRGFSNNGIETDGISSPDTVNDDFIGIEPTDRDSYHSGIIETEYLKKCEQQQK